MGNKFVGFANNLGSTSDEGLGMALRKFGRAWHTVADGDMGHVGIYAVLNQGVSSV